MVRVSGLGIYVFSVCKGKFGEVERLTVVVVEMVVGVGRRGRCPPGDWKGSWMVSVTGVFTLVGGYGCCDSGWRQRHHFAA